MADPTQSTPIKPIHGEANSTDASAGVELTVVNPDAEDYGAAISVGTGERLALHYAFLFIQTSAGGHSRLYWDNDSLSSARDIDSFVDGGAGEDSMVLEGDLADEFRAGRPFTIANDSDNNGNYTSTGATYDADADQTTVTVATGSWSGTTADGDVTSTTFIDAGLTIVQTDYFGVASPVYGNWPLGAPRVGPKGHTVYVDTQAASDRTLAIIDGYAFTPVTKTGPLAPQAR